MPFPILFKGVPLKERERFTFFVTINPHNFPSTLSCRNNTAAQSVINNVSQRALVLPHSPQRCPHLNPCFAAQ